MTCEQSDILLVEDSQTQALKLSLLLEAEGLAVHRVASGEEALEHLGRCRPDLVIVDYHLPGMHGDALCRLLRQNAAQDTLPLLLPADHCESDTRHTNQTRRPNT